jgi:hypothetical protein
MEGFEIMARAAWFRVAASIAIAAFLKAVIYVDKHNPRQPILWLLARFV